MQTNKSYASLVDARLADVALSAHFVSEALRDTPLARRFADTLPDWAAGFGWASTYESFQFLVR